MERGHAEALLPLIDRVVASVERGFPGLDRIAVTIGPGSYTGLRVGIAAARAIGLAAGVPVLGVTTLSAFLAPLAATDGNRLYAAAIDARHGQVYFRASRPAAGHMIPPCLVTLRDAARSSGPGRRPSRGPARPWSQRKPAVRSTPSPSEASLAPDILWVARLGLVADPAQALPKPLYLRAPDAKPQDQARLPRR